MSGLPVMTDEMAPMSWFAQSLGADFSGPDSTVTRVTTDSRNIQEGDLFVALRGERFDGHDYVSDALAGGAAGAIVDHLSSNDPRQIKVSDTLDALQKAAIAWRKEFSIPVIGITGSNGKTTTKQLLASVARARGETLATPGNLNNHIGLPLTVLSMRGSHRTAVIEMGANHLGEIACLTRIARPDVGVITQAGDAHLEGFGSRDGIARGKGELFAEMGEQGIAIINADDRYADLWRALAAGRQITFGIELEADIRATEIQLGDVGSQFELCILGDSVEVNLPLPGRHNIMNALAAAACATALGLDVETIGARLEAVEAAGGRLTWRSGLNGARLIDDSYNANPGSTSAALQLLADQKGERWAVLGQMAELGGESEKLHENCGSLARELGIDRLLVVGNAGRWYARGFGDGCEVFDDLATLIQELAPQLSADTVALVKGSRSAGMERVVEAFCMQADSHRGEN